jgi:mRNA interferase RelE/StbE
LVKVEWTGEAVEDLEKLDKIISQRIIKKLDWVSCNFEHIIPEPLSGKLKGLFKIRAGDWRIIYTVEKDSIVIQYIAHRREIYRI